MSVVHDAPPSSEYSIVREPTPPGTDSVQVMLTLFTVMTSPPLGAVTATAGLSRPINHTSVFCSTSLRSADASFASSIIAHSK